MVGWFLLYLIIHLHYSRFKIKTFIYFKISFKDFIKKNTNHSIPNIAVHHYSFVYSVKWVMIVIIKLKIVGLNLSVSIVLSMIVLTQY